MKQLIVIALTMVSAGFVFSADQDRTQEQASVQTRQQEQVYGYQLMTEQERTDYQMRMRNAKTNEEREQIRKEHHEKMMARAKEQGVAIPKSMRSSNRGGPARDSTKGGSRR